MDFKIVFLNYCLDNESNDVQNSCVFLSKKNESKFIKFDLNKKWFNIELILNNSLLNKRNAKIDFLKDENLNENRVYIPYLLWFNLTNGLFLTIKQKNELILRLKEKETVEEPKILNECYFTLIRSPNYPTLSDYNLLFQTYFQKLRYLELNDVIAVSTENCPEIYNNVAFKSHVKLNLVYFKITSIQNEKFGLIEKKKTKIYLTGTTNNFIPFSLFLNQYSFFQNMYQNIESINYLNDYYKNLESIASSYLKIKSILNIILINGESGSGKRFLIEELAKNFNLNFVDLDAEEFISDSVLTSEIKIKTKFSLISTFAPCIFIIWNIDVLFKSFKENELRILQCIEKCLTNELNQDSLFLVIATLDQKENNFIKESLFSKLFTYYFTISSLKEDERNEILNFLIDKYSIDIDSKSVLNLCKETNGFNLKTIEKLFIKTYLDNDFKACSENKFKIESKKLFSNLVYIKTNKKIQSKMPLIPNVQWEDVGGLLEAKKEILNTIQFPLKYSKYLKFKLKRSGILFFGPPGTGKTLLAKAIATECNLSFLSVKGPEIMNMYIGQSEENIRNLFANAKKVAPSIIFFDELDSIAPCRGKNNSGSGIMDRLVSTLLTEIDNMNDQIDDDSEDFKQVFIIGATNRPDLLDNALLRPGRFDRLVYIDLPRKTDQRINILKALTRKFKLSNDFSLVELEKKCPQFLTGADFYSLCSSAMSNSIKRIISNIENKQVDQNNLQIELCNVDFENALKWLKSSVSKKDLQKYEYLKMKFTSNK